MAYEAPPSCFGENWDPHEPECAGGRDPTFKDEHGAQVRKRCDFFSTCGARSQAKKQASAGRGVIPVANLTRPSYSVQQSQQPQQPYSWMAHTRPQATPSPAPAPAPSPTPPGWQQAMNGYFTQLQQQQNQPPPLTRWQPPGNTWQPPQQPQQWQPPQQLQIPPQVPGYQQMMPVNYMMPSYLSVPEPRTEDSSIWAILAKEIARSAFKSTGHTVSHFFDWTPWG